jgi:flagellar FliL protein
MPKAEEESEATAAAAPAAKTPNVWLPVVVIIVLMPAISFAMTQFVLIPHIQSSLGAQQANGASADGKGGAKTDPNKPAKPTFSYQFDDIVVNLSGAMGTKYLKTSFALFSSNPDLQKIITDNKSHLLDVALNVLSSKSMADLEAPGSKNLVRNDLITNFNQALNSEVIEQIYFSEFVVQ